MRDMLFLVKVKPGTSPFCTWVNEPDDPPFQNGWLVCQSWRDQ